MSEDNQHHLGLTPSMGFSGILHAVRPGAPTVGSPRPVRHEGYQAMYRARCGTLVYRVFNADLGQGMKMFDPSDVHACKRCKKAVLKEGAVGCERRSFEVSASLPKRNDDGDERDELLWKELKERVLAICAEDRYEHLIVDCS